VTFKFRESIGSLKTKNRTELTDRQKEILTLLKQYPLNGAQILNKLKDSPAIRTVQVDLTQLEKLGFVKREGKARATVWKLVKND
jgi:Fe2+ or Zn2+ uptake regulation protein